MKGREIKIGFADWRSDFPTPPILERENAALKEINKDLYDALERMIRLLRENYQLDDLADQVVLKAESVLEKARGE